MHLRAVQAGRRDGLQVPLLVYGGNSPPEGAPVTMAMQPQDPESWHVQVPLPLSATCDLQCAGSSVCSYLCRMEVDRTTEGRPAVVIATAWLKVSSKHHLSLLQQLHTALPGLSLKSPGLVCIRLHK